MPASRSATAPRTKLTVEQRGAARSAGRAVHATGPSPAPSQRWLPVAVPFLLMLTFGLFRCTRPVLSWDEIATADAAHRSVAQIWQLLHHVDGVFGPYYLLMHLWTGLLGDSSLSLRLPSILAMAAAAGVTGELGRRVAGRTAGVVAGALLCLLPNMSRYAAEARPYAMACLFSILALLLLQRACEQPGRGRWAAYAGATIALGASSLVALTALAGHLVIVLIRVRDSPRRWRSLLLPWCAAALGTAALVTPLIWWGLHQRSGQLHWVPPMSLGGVYTFPAHLAGSAEVAWLLIGLLLVALCRPARPVVEMVTAAAVPTVVVFVVSVAGSSFWVNRYLLFVLLPAVIVVAAGLVRNQVGRLPQLAVVLAVFAAAALPGQLAVRQSTVKNGSDYRALASVVRERQQPGDVMVFSPGRTMRTGLDYYLRHDDGRPRDVLLRRSAAQTATLLAEEHPDSVGRLATAGRIWLVAYGERAEPATTRPDLRRLLRDRYLRTGIWRVKNGTMALYTHRG